MKTKNFDLITSKKCNSNNIEKLKITIEKKKRKDFCLFIFHTNP